MAKRYQLTTKRSGVKEITYSLDDMETPFRLPWATTSLAEIEQLIALDDEIRIDGVSFIPSIGNILSLL